MARKSKYTEYIESISDEDSNVFIEEVRHLYIDKGLTMKEISDKTGISFKVIRGCISSNNFKKSKEDHYASIVRHTKETNLKKYGTECSLNSESSIMKKKATWIDHYGVDNPSKSDFIKQKKEETCIDHYGVRCHLMSEKIKNKIMETNLKRYGFTSPNKSKDVIERTVKTNIRKYGVSNTFHISKSSINRRASIRAKKTPKYIAEIIYNKERLKEFIESIPYENRTFYNICDKLGYFSQTIARNYRSFELDKELPVLVKSFRSHYEDELIDFIKSIGISDDDICRNNRSEIHPYELDIFIWSKNIAIEFNGDYWHSDANIQDNCYHQNKSILAKSRGIFVYNIWEHEWNNPEKQDIIKSQISGLLNNNKKIYARECSLVEISSQELHNFLKENHLQGSRNSSIRIGLKYNDELLSVMSFGYNRFIRRSSSDIELLRLCSKKYTAVIGGASKMFKYAVDKYDISSAISYCDISKGRGIVYEKLGFKLDSITSPGYLWINLKTGEILSRYQTQMKDEEEKMSSL